MASGFNDAAWLAERALVRIYGSAPEVAERRSGHSRMTNGDLSFGC
jgi:hypothetical protein